MHKDIPSATHPDVSVHITWPKDKESKIILRAYAIESDTGIRKEYSRERKRVANSIEDIATKQQHLYKAVCDDIERFERRPIAKTPVAPLSPMHLAFELLKSSSDPVSSDWSAEYTRKCLTHFQRNILPILATINPDDLTDDTREKLQLQLVEKILKSGHSAGHEPTAISTATKVLGAANTIYQRMRDYVPDLPKLALKPTSGRRSKNEMMKSIPPVVRRRFAKLIEELIPENPRLAMSVVAMYDTGLRTAEAAAVWSDVIVPLGDVFSILVRYQAKLGKRCNVLKTRNAYRMVPLSFWGHMMLARCIGLITANPDDEANWVCDTRLLSATIKSMLVKAGLTEEYFSSAEKMMKHKPDYDDAGRPIYDVSAYILRRDWASRARNICGYTALELDYSLGHAVKIAAKKREDFRHPSGQAKLAAKLERYVHTPLYSKHPGCTPYSAQHSTELELIPYDVIRIRNTSTERISLDLDVEAVANSERITVLAPTDSQNKSTVRSIRTDCKRLNEPIIGKSFITEDGKLEISGA